MTFRNPRFLWIAAGIAFALLAAWSLRYFSGVEPLTALTQNYAKAGLGQIGLQAQEARVIGHDRGRRRWRMAARIVTFSRDRRALTVDGIREGVFYDARERPRVSVTAGRALWQTPFGALGLSPVGTLRLDGGILATVLTPQRPLLQSQSVLWDSLRNTLLSPGPVTAAVPRLSVTAGNARYALPAGPASAASGGLTGGTLHLGGNVRAVFQARQGRATLTCPGLDWDAAQGLARSRGPVTVQFPGGLGTASAADVQTDTRTGNLTGHDFRGTLRLPDGVQ